MKVIELCLSPDLGGLELYMYRCCEALGLAGDSVVPVIQPGAKLQGYMDRLSLPVKSLSPRVRVMPLASARRLAGWVDQEEVDAIHVHWGKDLPLAALAKAISRRKPRLVYTRQMMLTRSKDDPYHRFLYGQMDRMLTITEQLAVSAKAKLPGESREKVATLYYGVAEPEVWLDSEARAALRKTWKVAEKAVLVGVFGRIEAFKGQHLMIQALTNPMLEGKLIQLLIVGHAMDQTYQQSLRTQVERLGLSERVHFFDFVEQPQQWMQACDIVALTTRQETFGLVLAEAMRANVAVVGSRAGGVPEIIEHGKTGLLFEPDNSDSLAEQVAVMVDDGERRRLMAEAGKRYADQHFSPVEHYRALRRHLAGSESGEEA